MAATAQSKRWGVGADGRFFAATDPTTPTYHAVPGQPVMGQADDDYATHIFGRYVSGLRRYPELAIVRVGDIDATRAKEAAAEFQTILNHRGWSPISALYPLAHLGLARAAVLQGDAAQARKSYQDFFALWKDADADLPALIEAKKEYKRLK